MNLTDYKNLSPDERRKVSKEEKITLAENNSRECITVFQSYFTQVNDAVSEGLITEVDAYDFLKQLFNYAFDNVEPTFKNPVCKILFSGIKNVITNTKVKGLDSQANGKMGGRPKATPIEEKVEVIANPIQDLLKHHNAACLMNDHMTKESCSVVKEMITEGKLITIQEIENEYESRKK
jgi:hypothetical protein